MEVALLEIAGGEGYRSRATQEKTAMSSTQAVVHTMASEQEKPDLSTLRIENDKRKASSTGGRVGTIISVLLGVLVIAGGAYAYMHQVPAVEVAVVQRPSTDAPALLNASGYVTPQRRATVAAKITGRVTGVFFSEGQYVHGGYVLATLDDSDVRKTLATSIADRDATQAGLLDLQVQLKNAEIELHRAETLRAAGVQTQEALDNATTTVNSLKARIQLTKQQVITSEARIRESQQSVENTVIRAPYDGVIVSKDAQLGEMVSPNSAGGGFTRTGIATIVDMKSNEIEVDVNESYLARVVPGHPVTAVLDAYPDWKIPSHVLTIIPTADRQKATVKVRITFDKLDPRILPDMSVKVAFLSEETKALAKPSAALLVAQSVIHDEAGQKIVYVVKDKHVERRTVRVGANVGSNTEILSGVLAGDSVVVHGPAKLQDAEAVEIKGQQ